MPTKTSPIYRVNFQIILYDDGRVGLNYQDLPQFDGRPPPATIGINGADGRFYNQVTCTDDTTQLGFLPQADQSFIFRPEDLY